MPFGGLTLVGSMTVLEGSQDRTNLFAAARGDKSAILPFAKLHWTLVF